MKKDRTRLIMGVLLSLVLFSSSLGLWFYLQEQKMDKKLQNMEYVYVFAKDVKKGSKINDSDIKLERYPRKVVTWKPLSKGEILHRYAKTDLFKGEPIMASKLSFKPIVEKIVQQKRIEPKKHKEQTNTSDLKLKVDTITLPLESFHNIDPTLRSGNKVDIVSIDATAKDLRNGKKLKTRYAAIGVKVVSFGYGNTQYKNVTKKVSTSKGSKTILADTVTLAVTPKNVKNLLALYYKTKGFNAQRAYNEGNRGHLWLIKNRTSDEQLTKEKKKLLLDYKKPYSKQKRKRVKTQPLRIEYEK